MIKILQCQTNKLPAELRITQFACVLAGHFLYVEGPYFPFKVEGQKDLNASELAFLVYTMYITDLLFISKDFIDCIRDINSFINAMKFVTQSCFDPRKEKFSTLLRYLNIDRLISCGFREEPRH